MSPAPFLRVVGLSKRFGGVRAVIVAAGGWGGAGTSSLANIASAASRNRASPLASGFATASSTAGRGQEFGFRSERKSNGDR